MKKIGNTNDGNIIAEMTPEEWRGLNNAGKGEITQDDLIAWKMDFREKILSLMVSLRTKNRLFLAAGIFIKDDLRFPEGIPIKETVFKRNGKLLPFDTWCKAVLAGEINCMSIRKFGRGMQAELKDAIQSYLGNKAE